MHGRCAPLCQHPGCWESDRTRRHSRKYNRYIEQLLRHGSSSTRTPQGAAGGQLSGDSGLPVLTVQSLAVEDISARDHTENTTPVVTTGSHPPSTPAPSPHLHNVQVLLEAIKFSPSSLSFSPVLIWRPGRLPVKITPQPGRGQGKECIAVKTHNFNNALLPEKPAMFEREKQTRLHNTRPHSRLHHDSLDLLQDIPHYIVAEILEQLQSESTSTLSPHTPPPHHPQHIPTAPLTLTQHTTSEERASHPEFSHVPHSLVCDLSTGQLYHTADKKPISTRHRPTTKPSHPLLHSPNSAKNDVSCVKRKRIITQPSKNTSFSRALSKSPMSVLRKTESVLLSKHPPPPPPPTIHTIDHTLLPPHPTQATPPSTHHIMRYPLGNPAVPRIPHETLPNPLLAPYHKTPVASRGPENIFLHMRPAHIHNTRLVTLHSLSTQKSAQHHPTLIEEATDTKESMAAVHLPPIPLSPPPHSCPSPDHMHMGAEIQGDQLVLDREGEQVVHPLRDPSQSSVGRASKSETTPSAVGVVNGSQAPPPTAQS